ncbi:c-type cytochrome domain-containing protein [Tautonia marina]|uniref:c-type cytochrome domain-containing protein n=1 Tax=Tautonia marina TaxID=2653855 RepID=UPI001261390F|nr:c-type cytochrome domain-containing protein [Tautonia marina]
MRMRSTFPPLLCLLLTVGVATVTQARQLEVNVPERDEPVSYITELIDILDVRCAGCHNSALAENDLNMEEVAGMLKGGTSGPSIVPGKAEESLLFQMAAHTVEPFMPPVEKNLEPMTPDELGLLKLWIDQGAKDDTEEMMAELEAADAAIELGALPPGVNPVLAVDLTGDGNELAVGRANVVQVFDAKTGQEVITLGGHQDLIQSIRFSPDGSRLAAGSYRIVTVWNAPKGAQARSFDGLGAKVNAIAASNDGATVVAVLEDGSIRVADATSDAEIRTIGPAEGGALHAVTLPSEAGVIATGGADGVIRLWKLEDGAAIGNHKAHEGAIHALAFVGPDAKRLATAGEDGVVRIWSLPEGPGAGFPEGAEPVERTGHEGPVRALAVTPDGSAVISGGQDGTVRIWSIEGDGEPRTIAAHEGAVQALACSPDGGTVVSGGADGTARLWSLADGAAGVVVNAHEGGVRAVAVSPSGDRIATAGANGLKVWEAETGVGVVAFGHVNAEDPTKVAAVSALAFAGDGRVVSGAEDQGMKVWTFEGQWSLHTTLEPHVFRVLAIDFSPDGKLIATGGGEPAGSGEVKLWDAETGNLLLDLPELHSDTVFGVKFRPDGTSLATGAADKFVRVVAIPSGERLKAFEGHTHHVMSVDWNTEGTQLVSGGADNVLKFWDYENGEQLRTSQAVGSQVTSVRWVPGKKEAIGASGDKTVRLFNVDNGRIQRGFNGPTDYVYSVATSGDGSIVAAGDDTGAIFLWKGADGALIRKIEPFSGARPEPSLTAGREE